jgi:hypothetical protein
VPRPAALSRARPMIHRAAGARRRSVPPTSGWRSRVGAAFSRRRKQVQRLVRGLRGLTPIYSIGIYGGPSLQQLAPLAGTANPAIGPEAVSDVPARFVADPFMLEMNGSWHMFFEVMNGRTDIGEIGLAVSRDAVRWTYQSIVLREPFHLSYPYVFTWDGHVFMIPETHQAGAVRLYRADPFPWTWRFIGALVEGPYLVDASPFRSGDRWWMFAETNPDLSCDTLRLYSSRALDGGWREHPASPIVLGNAHIARPAGRIVVDDERIVRFAQDCDPAYGLSVNAFEVLEITATTYRERPLTPGPLLGAGPFRWNRHGMHHIDAHRCDDGSWLACVDGWVGVESRSRS